MIGQSRTRSDAGGTANVPSCIFATIDLTDSAKPGSELAIGPTMSSSSNTTMQVAARLLRSPIFFDSHKNAGWADTAIMTAHNNMPIKGAVIFVAATLVAHLTTLHSPVSFSRI